MEENTNDLRKRVEDLYKERDFNGIVELLTDEVLENQKDAVLYGVWIKTNFQLKKDVAKTMVYAEKAIVSDPFNYIGYFARALVWANREKYINAVIDFSKAIELNMDFADAYYNRGLAWQNLKVKINAMADFDNAIDKYEKAIELNSNDAELYLYKGNAWFNKLDYDNENDKANKDIYTQVIKDYSKVIEINSSYDVAFYNRGLVWLAYKKYDKAIDDYTKAINLNSNYKDVYYNERGSAWKAKYKNTKAIKEYTKAIEDYTKAIDLNPKFANAYYNRGLAKIESNEDNEGSKQDFKIYQDLTSEENDIGVRYAKYYIKKLDEKDDPALFEISELVRKIKDILLINEGCITHYTSLSSIKSLILDCSKFRISEGNFMNDPSEGMEFFNYLGYNPSLIKMNTSFDNCNRFSPKPFIGSFVVKEKCNDLDMWRFYGKEDGVEAKGCSITLDMKHYIGDIKNSLSNEKNKDARIDDESDINFYRVVYKVYKQRLNSTDFHIPELDSQTISEFSNVMGKLKEKVGSYNGKNKSNLEEYLNAIAFLFKRDDYENENEVRLVMNGIEFEKKISKEDKSVNPPRVYIEIEPIRKRVKEIILGPKVDKSNEWASALYNSYKKENYIPDIWISHLPFK